MKRRILASLALLGAAAAAPVAADVRVVRSGGSVTICNDVGSGWLVKGHGPSDGYLVGRRDVATPFDEAIRETSSRNGVDARLVRSVILVESNFNPRAVSRKGARGLMQLMPLTALRYGVRNVHDAADNIKGGVAYLADLMVAFRGDLPLVLAAYNAGEGAVQRHAGVPPYPETQEYVRRAMLVYGGGGGPLLGGGFRGVAARGGRTVPASAPVSLARQDGAPVISNVADNRRAVPVLGRVATGDVRRTR